MKLLSITLAGLFLFSTSNAFAENFKSDRLMSAERQAHRAEMKARKDEIKAIENDEEREAAKAAFKAERESFRAAKQAEHTQAMLDQGMSQEEIDAKIAAKQERRSQRRGGKRRGK